MKLTFGVSIVLAGLVRLASSQEVAGTAEGFAYGVTGGGDATPDYPADIDELTDMLTDDVPRVIVLDKEFDFTESEGTTTGTVCASWGTGSSCQRIIQDDCGDSTQETATWYNAPKTPINVASNKTIVGVSDKGIIKGKGLRMRTGCQNVIIQNIQVSDLNDKFVWGGDAISFDGADQVWVDHVTTARPGRQHYCFGHEASTRITLSNNFIDGESTYSTGCNGYHYWTFEMVGAADQITMKNNYIYHTSGRGPALSGGTLLHAVNNVWEDIDGHALEGGEPTARGIFEGNVFIDVKTLVGDYQGKLFSSPDAETNAQCESALGRSCEINAFDNTSDSFDYTDTSFFSDFSGLAIASADSASDAKSQVSGNAGMGKLSDSISTDKSPTSASQTSVSSTPQVTSQPTTSASVSISEPAVSEQATEFVSTTKSAPASESVSTTKSAPASESASASESDVSLYGQCGGKAYIGSTTCAQGTCVQYNEWYSQCINGN